MTRLLTVADLDHQLRDLADWSHRDGALHAHYQFPSFLAAIRCVVEVAEESESMNHHPDIDVRWNRLAFTLSTHSAGGITQLDIELAHHITRLAATEDGTSVD